MYGKARSVREHFRAKLAMLEYEERIGRVINNADAEEVLFTAARVIRDQFLMAARPMGEALSEQFMVDKRAITLAVRGHIKDTLREVN